MVFSEWFQVVLSVVGFFGMLFLLLIAVAILLGVVALLKRKKKKKPSELLPDFEITYLNELYEDHVEDFKEGVGFYVQESKQETKARIKAWNEKHHPKISKSKKDIVSVEKPRAYLFDFHGDVGASQVAQLRDFVTTVCLAGKKGDEVVVRLESPGGVVHGYGLAASQLSRLKNAGFTLTICVDKVAASGGYMMACLADKIFCAPFSILGSVGVVAQIPNFNRALKKFDVDIFEMTAGEFKRTLSPLGEVTEKGKQKLQEQLEETHVLFKEFVSRARPQLDLAKIATGEHWYGTQAFELKLADRVCTSDEYIQELQQTKDVYLVALKVKETLRQKLLGFFGESIRALETQFASSQQQKKHSKFSVMH
jgi:serine protease SohB